MATAETLLTLCLPDAVQRTALLAKSRESLSLWSPWLTPLPTGNGAGDDPTYEDDFQLMREEINKLSGIDIIFLLRQGGGLNEVIMLESMGSLVIAGKSLSGPKQAGR